MIRLDTNPKHNCDECYEDKPLALIGDDPAHRAQVCADCLRQAIALLEGESTDLVDPDDDGELPLIAMSFADDEADEESN